MFLPSRLRASPNLLTEAPPCRRDALLPKRLALGALHPEPNLHPLPHLYPRYPHWIKNPHPCLLRLGSKGVEVRSYIILEFSENPVLNLKINTFLEADDNSTLEFLEKP